MEQIVIFWERKLCLGLDCGCQHEYVILRYRALRGQDNAALFSSNPSSAHSPSQACLRTQGKIESQIQGVGCVMGKGGSGPK